ncbi:Nif3-like dinuclear metal center hexameric protein [Granulicoccus sp. GXG6511]|uniref:Nif3-like dinuclear metal center hexameric protein n=1 Tax=Granulicoccus sp. GXG6511 TaxID=3381351 RepID=UPI003D7EC9F8
MSTTVADVVRLVEAHYPPRTAEGWDKVGLVCGAADWPVTSVLFTVDITPEVVAEAVEHGADLIVAHHPLLLRGVHGVDGAHPKGRMLLDMIQHRIACYAAHTNADIAPDGVCVALAEALGLAALSQLDPRPVERLDQLVAFVPQGHTEAVVSACAEAGAGRVGAYDHCHFRVTGTGSFRPLEGADPFVGTVGEVEHVPEDRVELVLPRGRRAAVVAAMRAAHPYEEPAFHILELAPTDTAHGIGRVGELGAPVSAAEFAQRVADALPRTVTGVRLAGPGDRPIRRVAVLAGAGDSHLDAARAAGVDAYVTSDLRHHPATEAVAWAGAPVLIDVAHWAAEWPWLPVLSDLVGAAVPGLERRVSRLNTDAWTQRFDGTAG